MFSNIALIACQLHRPGEERSQLQSYQHCRCRNQGKELAYMQQAGSVTLGVDVNFSVNTFTAAVLTACLQAHLIMLMCVQVLCCSGHLDLLNTPDGTVTSQQQAGNIFLSIRVSCLCVTPFSSRGWAAALQACLRHASCGYRYCAAVATSVGLHASSANVTSQRAGSVILGTTVTFPLNSSTTAGLAAYLQAYLKASPMAAFKSDGSFASDYGAVSFSSFTSVGIGIFTQSSLLASKLAMSLRVVLSAREPAVCALFVYPSSYLCVVCTKQVVHSVKVVPWQVLVK